MQLKKHCKKCNQIIIEIILPEDHNEWYHSDEWYSNFKEMIICGIAELTSEDYQKMFKIRRRKWKKN